MTGKIIFIASDGTRISGKGVHTCMYKVMGVCFADFPSFFLKYPTKMK